MAATARDPSVNWRRLIAGKERVMVEVPEKSGEPREAMRSLRNFYQTYLVGIRQSEISESDSDFAPPGNGGVQRIRRVAKMELEYVDRPSTGIAHTRPPLSATGTSMAKIPHIALLIETSREYGRGLLRGVARYHHERGPWSIYFEPHGLNDRPPSWLKNWRGDGILARIDDQRMADVILATALPAVDVRGPENLPIPFVGLDNRPIREFWI